MTNYLDEESSLIFTGSCRSWEWEFQFNREGSNLSQQDRDHVQVSSSAEYRSDRHHPLWTRGTVLSGEPGESGAAPFQRAPS